MPMDWEKNIFNDTCVEKSARYKTYGQYNESVYYSGFKVRT